MHKCAQEQRSNSTDKALALQAKQAVKIDQNRFFLSRRIDFLVIYLLSFLAVPPQLTFVLDHTFQEAEQRCFCPYRLQSVQVLTCEEKRWLLADEALRWRAET